MTVEGDPGRPHSLAVAPSRPMRPGEILPFHPRPPLVLVLGVPDSGEIIVCKILNLLGIETGSPLVKQRSRELDDRHGPDPHRQIADLHRRVLGWFDRSPATPLGDFSLPVGWWADPRVARLKPEISGLVQDRIQHGSFGLWDQDTTRLFPMWRQVCTTLRLSPKIIFCVRNPARPVQDSAGDRAADSDLAEYRWFINTIAFFRYTRYCETCIINYEKWQTDPLQNLGKLCQYLGLDPGEFGDDAASVVYGLMDVESTRGGGHPVEELSRRSPRIPVVRRLYELVLSADSNPAARDEIEAFGSHLAAFQQLHAPVERNFAGVVELAEVLPNISRDCDALRATLSEITREHEQTKAKARSEIEKALARVSAVEAERDTIAERAGATEEALTQALGEIEAGSLRLAAVQSEREATRNRAEAAEESLASALADVEAATIRLAEAEAERDAAGDRAEAAQRALAHATAEIETVANRFAAIERERDVARGRADTIEEALAEARTGVQAAIARLAGIEAERDAAVERAEAAEGSLAQTRADLEASVRRLADVEAQRDAATERAVAAEQALAEAQAEIGTTRARLDEIEAERNAAAGRAEAREEALVRIRAEIEAERDAAATFIHAMQTEAQAAHMAADENARDLAELKDHSAQRERELLDLLQARGDEFGERIAMLGTEAAERTETVARLTNELRTMQALADERLANLDILRAERDASLARAQELDQERNVEAEQFRRRLDAISEQLVAARRAGAAMAAAFCEAPKEPTAEPPPREAWFTSLFRRVGLWNMRRTA